MGVIREVGRCSSYTWAMGWMVGAVPPIPYFPWGGSFVNGITIFIEAYSLVRESGFSEFLEITVTESLSCDSVTPLLSSTFSECVYRILSHISCCGILYHCCLCKGSDQRDVDVLQFLMQAFGWNRYHRICLFGYRTRINCPGPGFHEVVDGRFVVDQK